MTKIEGGKVKRLRMKCTISKCFVYLKAQNQERNQFFSLGSVQQTKHRKREEEIERREK
jgi:hypothetical protein